MGVVDVGVVDLRVTHGVSHNVIPLMLDVLYLLLIVVLISAFCVSPAAGSHLCIYDWKIIRGHLPNDI